MSIEKENISTKYAGFNPFYIIKSSFKMSMFFLDFFHAILLSLVYDSRLVVAVARFQSSF